MAGYCASIALSLGRGLPHRACRKRQACAGDHGPPEPMSVDASSPVYPRSFGREEIRPLGRKRSAPGTGRSGGFPLLTLESIYRVLDEA